VNTMVDITVFLQGAMQSNGTMNGRLQQDNLLPTTDPYGTGTTCANINNAAQVGNVVDWVLVEIRKTSTPAAVAERKALLLRTDGKIVDVNGNTPGFTPTTDAVYVVVKHRNHLSVASTAISPFTGNISHDFSTGLNKAFKYNEWTIPMVQSNGKYCMWVGDINGDEKADSDDTNAMLSPVSKMESGSYTNADVTLDGTVDSSDQNSVLSPISRMIISPISNWK